MLSWLAGDVLDHGIAGLAMAAVWYVFYRNPTSASRRTDSLSDAGDPPGQRTVVTFGNGSVVPLRTT
jgi:hypothetical protein